jgi:hypothetical protein
MTYLLHKHTRLPHFAKEIPIMRLHDAACFLIQETEDTAADTWDHYIDQLCQAVIHQGALFKIFPPASLYYFHLTLEEKMAAAAAINNAEVFRMLLAQFPGDESKRPGYVYMPLIGNPIAIAARFGYDDILDSAFNYISTIPERRAELLREWWQIASIAEDATKHQDLSYLHRILQFFTVKHFKLPCRIPFERMLRAAIKNKNTPALLAILDVRVRSNLRLNMQLFEHLCVYGDPAVIAKVINKELVDLHAIKPIRYYPHRVSPLDVALEYGSPAVVAAVLEGGAPVNGLPDYAGLIKPPLQGAIWGRRDPEKVKLLLDHGAHVENADNSRASDFLRLAVLVKNKTIYDMIRKAKTEKTGKWFPNYEAAVEINEREEKELQAREKDNRWRRFGRWQ